MCVEQHFYSSFLFSVVEEFGRIALEFLRRGTSPKIYEGAASKFSLFTAVDVWFDPDVLSLLLQLS